MALGSGRQELVAFSDADWASDKETRKSNSGYIFMLNGGTISWKCQKQSCIALSSTEAEYVALSETCREMIWLKKILRDFGIRNKQPTILNTDNQSAMKLTWSENFSDKTKHIDLKHHYAKLMHQEGKINLQYVPTEHNIADLLTKPLEGIRIKYLRELANLV